jgi:hypothetical protein
VDIQSFIVKRGAAQEDQVTFTVEIVAISRPVCYERQEMLDIPVQGNRRYRSSPCAVDTYHRLI